MAAGDGPTEPEDINPSDSKPNRQQDQPVAVNTEDSNADDDGDEADDDEEEEEEEPRLKYAPLTRNISGVYRNGDATSASLVAGDKLIIGTHYGNIHVYTMPSLQILDTYHAHKASVSAISISPFPPPFPTPAKLDAASRLAVESATGKDSSPSTPPSSPRSKSTPKRNTVPKQPSNEIYIATSSIDGNVCVRSLVDPKDVQLRNFGRPVQAVALSPQYRSDKSYLSGGQAGELTLTVGGQTGKSANATTTGAAAAASGWLGSIGLGANTGNDKVLHSGEGIISTIKWSLSGKYVLWVNEYGIKIMRTNLKLENAESNLEWKRISHIPRRDKWGDEAAVHKPRAEWFDRSNLEPDVESSASDNESTNGTVSKELQEDQKEEFLVGWVDFVWLIRVVPDKKSGGAGHAEVTKKLELSDCIISGASLYTPSSLLILAYMQRKDQDSSKQSDETGKKGRHNRHNALAPELRLIDINSEEEVETDTLSVDRFATCSSSDYHLGMLFPIKIPAQLAQKGYLQQLGTGVTTVGSGIYQGAETVGQGMWDATMYGPRLLGANRLFSGGETGSIRSGKLETDRSPSVKGSNFMTSWMPGFSSSAVAENENLRSVAATFGMKIFIFSPFDCIVAVKRNLTDRVEWLVTTKRYQEAWELLDLHPEAAGVASDPSEPVTPPTPSKASSFAHSGSIGSPAPARPNHQQTLAEFFAESLSVTTSTKDGKSRFSNAEKEKRRIGELWLQSLVDAQQWDEAGDVASKVLNTKSRWEHWVFLFIKNNQYDAISSHVPAMELTPPLPSTIFEMILNHYVSTDRMRFKQLIDQWPSDLFEIHSITNAIQDQLESNQMNEDSQDWHVLQEVLAKLYLADGNYEGALRCYIRLQDAETAVSLVKDHHLMEAMADNIPAWVLLRISKSQLKQTPQQELQELSSEPIKLLVDEASTGVVAPEEVVSQLQQADLSLFIYFYLRALWRGEGIKSQQKPAGIRHRFDPANLTADEGKILVDQFADLATELFAKYDRDLLMEFLHSSSSYTFEKALKVCEDRKYIEEEVYLLSKTGSTKKALFLIIDELQDVSKAIAFAKEQDDTGLWEDLLDYSMSRPKFISGLLAEVGTAIDPITLVKRIPSGIEIEGLKDGLKKMIREYDLQDSISAGVAQVLSSEVAVGMDTLRRGRRRGIKFSVPEPKAPAVVVSESANNSDPPPSSDEPEPQYGRCAGCGNAFTIAETDVLIAFACGHVYHLTHLLNNNINNKPPSKKSESESEDENIDKANNHNLSLPNPKTSRKESESDDDGDEIFGFTRSIGPKVTTARLLRDKVEAMGGCRVCQETRDKIREVS